MKHTTIKQGWKEFADKFITPELPSEGVRALKMSYYAGAANVFENMSAIGDADAKQGSAILEEALQDLEEYTSELKEKKS